MEWQGRYQQEIRLLMFPALEYVLLICHSWLADQTRTVSKIWFTDDLADVFCDPPISVSPITVMRVHQTEDLREIQKLPIPLIDLLNLTPLHHITLQLARPRRRTDHD
jgi:hypothetical protein